MDGPEEVGGAPEVVEREITRPIEQALNTIDGLNEITSTSSEGSSSVRLNFNLGVDPVRMQPEVSVKVSRIRRQLPRDILDPTIQRYDPNDSPIMTIASVGHTAWQAVTISPSRISRSSRFAWMRAALMRCTQ